MRVRDPLDTDVTDSGSPFDHPHALHELEEALCEAIHALPTQGPISVFVHHNTLHALEGLKFDEALRRARDTYGCEVYFPEDRYRAEVRRGRIRPNDLFTALVEDLGDRADVLLGFQGTLCHLRLAMLKYPISAPTPAELRWLIAETDALRRFRADTPLAARQAVIDDTRRWVTRNRDSDPLLQEARLGRETSIDYWQETQWEEVTLELLWKICHRGVREASFDSKMTTSWRRHRDYVVELTGKDPDSMVHDVLIKVCSAFSDQGMARWSLPSRDRGFWRSFSQLFHSLGVLRRSEPWLRDLSNELRKHEQWEPWNPLNSIACSLHDLGVAPGEFTVFLQRTLLALRGWGGMLRQLESNAPWAPHPSPPGSLFEFAAIRLILDRLALKHLLASELGFRHPLRGFREWAQPKTEDPVTRRLSLQAFTVFQLSQVLGWSPRDLARLPRVQWKQIVDEVSAFSQHERRRVFHSAYERGYKSQALDAISIHDIARRQPPFSSDLDLQPGGQLGAKPVARCQTIFCIDDREESFRRHLEELSDDIVTFGTAGFFAVPMYYRGVGDAHYIPLCPIVVKPQHFVEESPLWTLEEDNHRRAQNRRTLGHASHRVRVGSHTFWLGTLTSLLGALASIPMILRVLFPLLSARIRNQWGGLLQPPSLTYLNLERIEKDPCPTGERHGFSVSEMATMVERLLRDIGLTEDFARLILIVGHGSSSLNNPHESAYNCGACGGGRGGPNARAAAHMANDHRVRQLLAKQGLILSEEVVFVGAYHNTCDDSVSYFDLDRIPVTHREDFLWLRDRMDQARELNAHERCRWFRSASVHITPREALTHVQERAEDLAQVRPEYNHATNAMCIVGRRDRTRGLFLDRRSFLCSYDPTHDDQGATILTRILQAVIPVCAGISLEYFFSSVDSSGFGCGSKLPHNIASFLGVMDGAASDLRPGLSRQMIETHEPMRLLFVIESRPEVVQAVLDANPSLRRMCTNEWIQMATLDPDSSTIHEWRGDKFVRYSIESDRLPIVDRSRDWYRGWREHLGFARIGRG